MMNTSDDPLRDAAVERAADLERERDAVASSEAARRAKQVARDAERRAAIQALDSSAGNESSQFARVAASDYTHNNTRAMVGPDGQPFLEPRWQPDEETENCTKCRREFDFFWHRKHHCRHCGFIFCDSCSSSRALLPVAFNQTDPQRVCAACFATLEPHQEQLSELIANAEKSNAVDMSEGSLMRYCNLPFSLTLGSEIRKASYSLHNMFTSDWLEDKDIPARLLTDAKGIAFLTIAKAGIVLAPKVGTGLVIAKLPNGTWSPPSAIATMGISWGFLAGADVTDFVIILNTHEAVKAFAGIGNVQIGAGLDIAMGPVGRGVSGGVGIGDQAYAPALSYSHSKGLFVGLSLDGSIIMTRNDVNHKFYGVKHEPMAILTGAVAQPKACEPLYNAINSHIDGGADDNEEGQSDRTPVVRGIPQPTSASAYSSSGAFRRGEVENYDTSFFDDGDRINI
jgi:SH3 domain-containing YSC84-like protein 1